MGVDLVWIGQTILKHAKSKYCDKWNGTVVILKIPLNVCFLLAATALKL